MRAPDSKIRFALAWPLGAGVLWTMAGMRPLGLMRRNQLSFCTFLLISMFLTS